MTLKLSLCLDYKRVRFGGGTPAGGGEDAPRPTEAGIPISLAPQRCQIVIAKGHSRASCS